MVRQFREILHFLIQAEVLLALLCLFSVKAFSAENSFEKGLITIDSNWKSVSLNASFSDPVIVAGLVSESDSEPGVVEIINASAQSFDIRFREWPYLDGIHAQETVSFLVLERGQTTLENGTIIEAGSTTLSSSWSSVSFTTEFEQFPSVVSTVLNNNGATLAPRYRQLSAAGFQIRQWGQERLIATQPAEVNWIAWPRGFTGDASAPTGAWETRSVFVDERSLSISLNESYDAPCLFADIVSPTSNPVSLRGQVGLDGVGTIRATEEQSADSETNLPLETVTYIVLDCDTETSSDDVPPVWQTGSLIATETGQNYVWLQWPLATDNAASVEYRISVDGVLYSTTTNTDYRLAGLEPSSTYQLSVIAVDPAGNVSSQLSLSVATENPLPPDTTAPFWTGDSLSVTDVLTTSAKAEWSAAEDNSSPLLYRLYLNEQFYSETFDTSIAIDGIETGTAYALDVYAQDPAGNTSTPLSISFYTVEPPPDTEPPSWEQGPLSATSTSAGMLFLQWPEAFDEFSIVTYRIFQNGILIAQSTDTSLDVVDLTPGTLYSFSVVAVDTSGNESSPIQSSVSIESEPPAGTPGGPPVKGAVYLSLKSNVSIDGMSYSDEDIIRVDQSLSSWQLVFDGSDVGITGDVDAFCYLANGDLLLSLTTPVTLPTLGRVDDSDILRFVPSSIGDDTQGTFHLYFDGSDVGLSAAGEDIDAVTLSPEGDLLVSVSGKMSVDGLIAEDEDLVRFTATELGDNTQGTWELFFDGSDMQLQAEDLWSASVTEENLVHMSTQSTFSVEVISGTPADVFTFSQSNVGSATSGQFSNSYLFKGADHGIRGKRIDALHFISLPPLDDGNLQVADGYDWTLPASARRSTGSGLTWINGVGTDDPINEANRLAENVFGIDGDSYVENRFAVFLQVDWSEVNYDEGLYDWSSIDAIVDDVHSRASPGVGYFIWPKIYGANIPIWVSDKYLTDFSADPREIFTLRDAADDYLFNQELSNFLMQLVERYGHDPRLVYIDMRSAFDTENGEWVIKGDSIPQDEINVFEWATSYHSLWSSVAQSYDFDVSKLVSVIAWYSYGGSEILSQAYLAGMGQRDGQPSRRQIWSEAYGTSIDDEGYVLVDELSPAHLTNGVSYSEATEFNFIGTRFGPTSSTYERFQAALLWALQIRRDWLAFSPSFLKPTSEWPFTSLSNNLKKDYETSQEMIKWAQLELGHTAETAPDAWAWTKETTYTRYDINAAPRDDSETTVAKNVERWLYQRDVPDIGQTRPAFPIHRNDIFGPARAGIYCPDDYCLDYRARSTDIENGSSGMYFSLSPEFLDGNPHDITLKITYYDLLDADWIVDLATPDGTQSTEAVRGHGTNRIRTVTFQLDNMLFNGQFDGGMDFRIRATHTNDPAIRFVRIIR